MNNEIPGFTRRQFIKIVGLAGTGLVVGCTLSPLKKQQDPQNSEETLQQFALNAWIEITTDNRVIFTLDKVEMGQGTMTSHTMMVAEELEIPPGEIEVIFAPAQNKYVNAKFSHGEIGLQMTGGSTSVAASWEPLRRAAACAREMLKLAAAARWDVDDTQCKIAGKSVVCATTSEAFTFGALALSAKNIELASIPEPKNKDFRYIGHDEIERLDIMDKVLGRAKFGIDCLLDEMLNAVVIRCPYVGQVASIKDPEKTISRLRVEPGVQCVFQIPPTQGWQSARKCVSAQAPLSPVSTGIAVVAETFWQAHKAAEKYRHAIQWNHAGRCERSGNIRRIDHGDSVFTALEAAMKAHDVELPDEILNDEPGSQRGEQWLENFDAGVRTTGKLTYQFPFLPHSTLEPMNCTVSYKDDRCEVWAPTQAPKGALGVVKQITKLSEQYIKIHTTLIGGGFGRRINQDYVAEATVIAVQLSKYGIQRPVKLTWTREDDFQHDFFRPPSVHHINGGIKQQNTLEAYWNHRIAGPSVLESVVDDFILDIGATTWLSSVFPELPKKLAGVASAFTQGVVPRQDAVEGALHPPYLPKSNHRLDYLFYDPGVPIGFWRSVGHFSNAFVIETFIDHLAVLADEQDRADFRRQLILQNHDHPTRLIGVLDAVCKLSGWGNTLGFSSGRGIAVHESFNTYCAQVATISKDDSGKIRVDAIYCAVDCGRMIHPDIVKQQVEGAIIFGLSAALKQKVTLYEDEDPDTKPEYRGRIVQTNFHACDPLRIYETPDIHVVCINNDEKPTGIGEPGVPPVAPAVANAIFDLTGRRQYSLPLVLEVPPNHWTDFLKNKQTSERCLKWALGPKKFIF